MNEEQQNLKEVAILAGVVLFVMQKDSDEGVSDEIVKEAKKHTELAEMVTSDSSIVNLAYKHLLNYAAMKESLKESNEVS